MTEPFPDQLDTAMTMTSAPMHLEVSANGLTFHTLRWGTPGARPVLLLHGFPQSAQTWDEIAQRLACKNYCVYAFDQRGYRPDTMGHSAKDYNFDAFVADAMGVADALKFESFYLGGFGMGAAQAWTVAARYPQRIRALVAIRFPHPAAFAWSLENDETQRKVWTDFTQMLGDDDLDARVASMLADNAKNLRVFLSESGLKGAWLDRYVGRMQVPGVLKGAFSWENALSPQEMSQTPVILKPTLFIWSRGPGISESAAKKSADFVTASYSETEISNVGNFILENASDEVGTAFTAFWEKNP